MVPYWVVGTGERAGLAGESRCGRLSMQTLKGQIVPACLAQYTGHAMTVPTQFLDELKSRVDLAALIARKVKLIKRGREYQGLCPFHKEKSPSFSVVPDKGFYHCFGCGQHGSAIDFVMQTEGASFPEAVERLAGETGMEVPRDSPEERQRQSKRQGLHEIMALVTTWYESQLASAAGAQARDYISGRGLDEKTIKTFQLGYAPDRRDALKSAMLNRGLEEADLLECGMLARPEDGGESYDRFRHRLMFPISDRRGRIVAFGGRALAAARAKYLNSPETPIFHKGGLLYNISGAAKPAYDDGQVLVVEGYMDVISLHRHGIQNAVAPLGTALTEDQMRQLWRMVPEPVLCFDGDAAGQRAAFRAAERSLPLLQPGHSLRFVELPTGEDPDSLVKTRGPAAIRTLLADAAPLSDLIWHRALREAPTDTPERRAGLRRRLKLYCQEIKETTVRDFYQSHFNQQLDRAFGPTNRPFSSAHRGQFDDRRRLAASRGLETPEYGLKRKQERNILAMLLNHPTLAEQVFDDLVTLNLESPDLDKLRGEILKHAGRGKTLDVKTLKDDLPDSNLVQLIDELTGTGIERSKSFTGPMAPMDAVIKVWAHISRLHRLDELRRELTEAERALGDDATEAALARFFTLQDAVHQAEAEATDVDSE